MQRSSVAECPRQSQVSNIPPAYISLLRTAGPLLAAFLISLAVSTIPRHPLTLDDKSSEAAVLDYARHEGWQFGTDMVFTYGPLGFLANRQFFAATAATRMVADAAFCFVVSAGLCLLAWRLSLWARGLLLGVFIFLCGNIDPRMDLLLYLGLLCWGLLCLKESGWRLFFCAASFTLLGVFGVLMKGNFIVFVGLSAAAIICHLILRGLWRAAISMGLGLVGGLVLGWVCSGQKLANLPDYFRNEFSIISTYDQTVGMEGLAALTSRGLLTLLLALAAVGARALTAQDTLKGGHQTWRRGVLLVWLCALIAMAWKHGFVRTDLYHTGVFFGFAAVLVLALEVVTSPEPRIQQPKNGPLTPALAEPLEGRPALSTPTTFTPDPSPIRWERGTDGERVKLRLAPEFWSRVLAFACCCVSVFTLQSLFFSSLSSSLIQPFRALALTLRDFSQPTRYAREMIQAREPVRREANLPKLSQIVSRSTVDIFGQNQAYGILNGLNYSPRPVFQSYLANNARLMRLNERFYLSDKAPAYVLFSLAPLDRKFPPLEDAVLLRDMLLNYQFIEAEGSFILLKTRPCVPPALELAREGTVKLGEAIPLSDLAGNLWMEIEVEPALIGRVRQWFFKPSKLRLGVWREHAPSPGSGFPAPRSMLAAGFFASPLLLRNEDVRAVLSGGAGVRPRAYSVEVPAAEKHFWQDSVRFRIYKVGNGVME